MIRWLALVSAIAGCGDNARTTDDPLAPVSGTRLTLQIYRYDDGTEEPAPSEFYDTQLHTRCSPQIAPDGALRCVPVADDAAYVDPACTMLVGLGRTITNPTHFLVYDQTAGSRRVAGVFRAGGPSAAPQETYALDNGACTGPTPVPQTISRFWTVSGAVDTASLAAFHAETLGEGRLGLEILRSDDGLSTPAALIDRALGDALGAACTPAFRGDGSAVCQPANAAVAQYFGDPACSVPAVVTSGAAPPAIAELPDASGCASYRSVSGELSAQIYRRDGSDCTPLDDPSARMFSLGAPLELIALERSLEQVPGRRIQRIVLSGDGLRWFADRVFDTAIGADCQPRALRDTYRCLPPDVTTAITLLDASCTAPVRVAEVAAPACGPLGFATTSRPFQLHAIGEPVTDPLFTLSNGLCTPYTGPANTERRTLGPSLDITGFATAIYYGERDLDPPP